MSGGKKNISNLFGWLDEIMLHKTPIQDISEKSWDVWNSYMIHRYISMCEDYIQIANYVQKENPQQKQQIYSIYKDVIPKKKMWNKYIKNQNSSPKSNLINYITKYYQCNSKEASDYVSILGKEGVEYILEKMGLDKKEIKKLNK